MEPQSYLRQGVIARSPADRRCRPRQHHQVSPRRARRRTRPCGASTAGSRSRLTGSDKAVVVIGGLDDAGGQGSNQAGGCRQGAYRQSLRRRTTPLSSAQHGEQEDRLHQGGGAGAVAVPGNANTTTPRCRGRSRGELWKAATMDRKLLEVSIKSPVCQRAPPRPASWRFSPKWGPSAIAASRARPDGRSSTLPGSTANWKDVEFVNGVDAGNQGRGRVWPGGRRTDRSTIHDATRGH